MSLRGVVLSTICSVTSAQLLSAGPSCIFGSGFDLVDGCNKASAVAAPLVPCKGDADPGPCIESKPHSSEVAYTRKVENSEQYNSMLSATVSAEGGGFGYHVSASTSYMTSSQTTDRSVSYFLGQSGSVRTDSIRGVIAMNASSEALDLLKQCESATSCDFVDRYGIHYIHQITYGRSFLGSFTMWDHSTSKSSSLGIMASFSANDVFFSASASADFQDKHSQQQEHLETIANGKWLGGTGVVLDGSSPSGMYNSFLNWNATSFDNPAPMTMTFRNWIDLPEIQKLINSKSEEVKSLFSPKKIVSATTNQITAELGQTGYALNAVSHALAWSCSQQQVDFKNALVALQQNLTTHLAKIESLSEANVLAIQAQILNGDYSFFFADQKLDAYTQLVTQYFPNGFCGVCTDEYKCGKSGCCPTADYPTCCPASPGQHTQDLCFKAGDACCTDAFSCKPGYVCFAEVSQCCHSGDMSCPSGTGKPEGSCCDEEYPNCCGLQGGDLCCSKGYEICCGPQGFPDKCCSKDYPVCKSDACYKSEEDAKMSSLDFIAHGKQNPRNHERGITRIGNTTSKWSKTLVFV